MKINKNTALIFDCDGTLIDSYDAISERVQRLFRLYNLTYEKEYIREVLLKHSTSYFVRQESEKHNLDYDTLWKQRDELEEKSELIRLINNAEEMLKKAYEIGADLYVYTHRDSSVNTIFETLGIRKYFKEIISINNGFKRKPDSEAIDYLVDRYKLNKDNTYYVGDRSLDIECGINAGIRTIFLKSADVQIDYSKADIVVDDLLEIVE